MVLLRRTKRRVELTDVGRVFLQEARATLAQADRAVRLAQRASRGEVGHLSVGLVPWADVTSIPGAIRTFGRRYPGVEIELHSLAAPEQTAALRDGRIHCGFTRPPVDAPDLVTALLVSEPLVVVFPRRHEFSAYRQVPWKLLGGQRYVAFSARRAPAYQAVVAQACREAGITLNIGHEADHPQMLLALVEAGVGVSLVPASSTRVKRPGIAHRTLRPAGPTLETIIAWRRDDGSAALRAFVDVAREIAGGARR